MCAITVRLFSGLRVAWQIGSDRIGSELALVWSGLVWSGVASVVESPAFPTAVGFADALDRAQHALKDG